MSDIAIRAENLSKLYRIGQFQSYGTLRDSLTNVFTAAFRRRQAKGHETEAYIPISANPGRLTLDSRPSTLDSSYIWALKDVSFEVKPGEAVGIIGRNGAGKTTLLKILSRITTPTEGYAEIRGRVSSLLEVGTGFHHELTGRENIYLNGAVLGMKKRDIERKFDDIVEFSGLETFLDTSLKRYSSGMQVRLAFAVAAHLEPEILLIDEVLAVGDYEFQKKCLGKMENVAKEGRTVLFVSHNMSAIIQLCERVILLDGAQLTMDGPAFQVVEHYQFAHVATCVHWERPESLQTSPEFSFISATARDADGKVCSIFPADQPIHIELVYKVHHQLSACQVSVYCTNSIGIQVFATADTDSQVVSQNESATPRVPGTYRAEFVIPGRFLAPGRYAMSLGACMPGRHNFDEFYNAIILEVSLTAAFQSVDTGVNVVAPLFVWQTGLHYASV